MSAKHRVGSLYLGSRSVTCFAPRGIGISFAASGTSRKILWSGKPDFFWSGFRAFGKDSGCCQGNRSAGPGSSYARFQNRVSAQTGPHAGIFPRRLATCRRDAAALKFPLRGWSVWVSIGRPLVLARHSLCSRVLARSGSPGQLYKQLPDTRAAWCLHNSLIPVLSTSIGQFWRYQTSRLRPTATVACW